MPGMMLLWALAASAAAAVGEYRVISVLEGDQTPPTQPRALSVCGEEDLPTTLGLASSDTRCLPSPDGRAWLLVKHREAMDSAMVSILRPGSSHPLDVGAFAFVDNAVWAPDAREVALLAESMSGERQSGGAEGSQPYIVDTRTGRFVRAGTVAGSAFSAAWCGTSKLAVLAAPDPEAIGDLFTGDLYLADTKRHVAKRVTNGLDLILAAAGPAGILAVVDATAVRLRLFDVNSGASAGDITIAEASGEGHFEDRIENLWWRSPSEVGLVTGAFGGISWSGERTFFVHLSKKGRRAGHRLFARRR